MNLTDDFTLKCLFGCPILFEDICAIFPVTLKEIASIGYSKFLQNLNLILIEKPSDLSNSEIGDIIENLTTFEYLLLMVGMDATLNQQMKDAFRFFTHDNITFSFDPPQIIIGPIEEKHLLNEEDFLEFRRIIRKMYFIDTENEIVEKEDDNPFVARIKKQMKKNREKLAKAKKVGDKKDNDMNFSDLVASLAVAQCGLNILSVQDMTYYAFHDQLKRMGWRDKFNINNRAALAGAKLKKEELKHWMRPINSKEK